MAKHKVHVTDKQDIIIPGGSVVWMTVTEDTPVPISFGDGTAAVPRSGDFVLKFRIPTSAEAKLYYDEPESPEEQDVDG